MNSEGDGGGMRPAAEGEGAAGDDVVRAEGGEAGEIANATTPVNDGAEGAAPPLLPVSSADESNVADVDAPAGAQVSASGNATGDTTQAAPSPRAARVVRTRDPWAHRRGEPRLFAVLWTLFLLASAAWAIGAGALAGAEVYLAGVRVTVLVATAGVVVLWPMVRLSQSPPGRGPGAFVVGPDGVRRATGPTTLTGAVLADWVVLMAPLQAILWPQTLRLMAGWPAEVIACVSAGIGAWGLLVAGVLRLALGVERGMDEGDPARHLRRAGWMAVVVLGAGLGALATAAGAEGAWRLSPFTLVHEVVRDRSWTGRVAQVPPGAWGAVGGVLAVAGGVWVVGMLWVRRGDGGADRLD